MQAHAAVHERQIPGLKILDDHALTRPRVHREEDEVHLAELVDVSLVDLYGVTYESPPQDVVPIEEIVDLQRLSPKLIERGSTRRSESIVCVQGVVIEQMDLRYGSLGDLIEDVRARTA